MSDMEYSSSEEYVSQVEKSQTSVYLPSVPLETGEELVHDESAYIMLHQASTGAPCLSFDVIQDNLGDCREDYPLSCYIIAGTQAQSFHLNNLIVMKMSNISKTFKEYSDEELSDSEDESCISNLPQMSCALIRHQGCVNRVRSNKIGNHILCATWSELGKVSIWNLNDQLQVNTYNAFNFFISNIKTT